MSILSQSIIGKLPDGLLIKREAMLSTYLDSMVARCEKLHVLFDREMVYELSSRIGETKVSLQRVRDELRLRGFWD